MFFPLTYCIASNYYGSFTYFFAKTTLDALTLRVVPVTLFALIFYWIMGLRNNAEHFLVFLCTLILFNVAAGSITACISNSVSSVGSANLLATVIFLTMLLFGGFLVNIDSIPSSVAWLKYISIFSYAFENIMTNELKSVKLVFDAPGYPEFPVIGDVFLETLGMNVENQTLNLFALAGIIVFFNAIAWALLHMRLSKGSSMSASASPRISSAVFAVDSKK